jgi:hypothetical protein
MIENRVANMVLFPDVIREEGGTWSMPGASNLETSLWPLRRSNEGFINFVDIAQLQEREEELRQNQQRLESLNEDLVELVAERTKQVGQLVSEVLITEQKVRESISQLLHDDLQQILVSIQLKSHTIRQSCRPATISFFKSACRIYIGLLIWPLMSPARWQLT